MDNTISLVMKSQVIKNIHSMRMNVSKLFGEWLKALERSIEDYRLKNVFSNIYRQYDKESTLEVLWYHDAQMLGTQAMKTASESIYARREEILPCYDKKINNGFTETVNNIQTTRRIAKGFENIDYFIAMVYFCNGGLEISFY